MSSLPPYFALFFLRPISRRPNMPHRSQTEALAVVSYMCRAGREPLTVHFLSCPSPFGGRISHHHRVGSSSSGSARFLTFSSLAMPRTGSGRRKYEPEEEDEPQDHRTPKRPLIPEWLQVGEGFVCRTFPLKGFAASPPPPCSLLFSPRLLQ